MPKLNVLIAGSTGYIGAQLVNLLAKHKNVNIKYLCGNNSVGKNISIYDKKLKILMETLDDLDLDSTTPKLALEILYKVKNRLIEV